MRKWTDRGDESLEQRIAGFATPHCWICNPAVPLRCSYTAATIELQPSFCHIIFKYCDIIRYITSQLIIYL